MEVVTAGLILLLSLLLYFSSRRPAGFPPGLVRLPLIGAAIWHLVGTRKPVEYTGRKLMGMFIGNTPAVVIESFQLAKELFSREEWCGRKNSLVTRYLRSDSGRSQGIVFGEDWEDQRRFAMKHLKSFGFGKSGHEGVIQDEVEEVVRILKSHHDKDFRMEEIFGIPAINLLWTIVAGKRFENNSPKAQQLLSLLNRMYQSNFAAEYGLPWWGVLAYCVPGLNGRSRINTQLRNMFREKIEEHRLSRDQNQPRDFMDAYLDEIEKDSSPGFHQESMELTILDLFKTGAATTATTLLWIVLHLTRQQEVQQQAREEVERVCGEERPGLHHALPYCQAVVQEVQRMSPVGAIGIPQLLTKTVEVEGYRLPKDSLALVNIYGFLHDPQVWQQPAHFRPERFLERTEDGVLKLVKREQFVPYGFGRRVCMGESLARDTLLLFTASLVKTLSFGEPEDHPLPDPENFTDGYTVIPKPFYVNIKTISNR